jgi:hypothetical protein
MSIRLVPAAFKCSIWVVRAKAGAMQAAKTMNARDSVRIVPRIGFSLIFSSPFCLSGKYYLASTLYSRGSRKKNYQFNYSSVCKHSGKEK